MNGGRFSILVITAVLVALAAPRAALAQTALITEDFRGTDVEDSNYLVGGRNFTPCLTASQNLTQKPIPGCPIRSPSVPASGDPNGGGALRLTSNGSDSGGFILYQDALPFTAGLDVEFEFFAYRGNGGGADGTSFFLADGVSDLQRSGPTGGGLGYTQNTTVAGVAGAYLGVGFDEYGNFGNDTGGKGAGCPVSAGSSLWRDRVSLRGAGSDLTGYCVVRRSGPLSSLDDPLASSREDVRRHVRVHVDPPSAPNAAVVVSLGYDSGPLTEVLDEPLPPNPPPTVKFGFAASTGGQTNIHEIRELAVQTVNSLPRLALEKTQDGPYTSAGQGTFVLTARTETAAGGGPEQSPITLTDDLPAGVLAGVPTGTGWDCSASSGAAVRCTHSASAAAPIPAGTTLPAISVPVAFGAKTSGRFTNLGRIDSLDNANTPEDSSGSVAYEVRPVGSDDSATTAVGAPVEIKVLANDLGDLNPATVTTTAPTNGSALWSTGNQVVTYVPYSGFSGSDSFTYTVQDRHGQQLHQTVRVNVTPEAISDSAATAFQTPVTIDVLANDHGSLVPSTAGAVSGPANGSVSFPNGRARYVPNEGFSGQDSFVYRVLDGAGQPATAIVVVDVGPAPPSPPITPSPEPTPEPTPPQPPPAQAPEAQLVVTKTTDPSAVRLGQTVTYHVLIENQGKGAAEDVMAVESPVQVVDTKTLRLSQGDCDLGPPAICRLGTIQPGEHVTITVVATPTTPGVVVNRLAVTAVNGDVRNSDNIDVARVAVVSRAASIRVTNRASRARVRPGQQVLFDIHVRSIGRDTAEQVRTCDLLPRGLELIRAPAAQSVRNGRRICWKRVALPRGEDLRYQVLARARTSKNRRATNAAVARGTNFATGRDGATVLLVQGARRPGFTG